MAPRNGELRAPAARDLDPTLNCFGLISARRTRHSLSLHAKRLSLPAESMNVQIWTTLWRVFLVNRQQWHSRYHRTHHKRFGAITSTAANLWTMSSHQNSVQTILKTRRLTRCSANSP